MSLNWDATQVKQWPIFTKQQKQITINGLVFHAMLCGFGEITEANIDEVYRRIAFSEKVNGALLHGIEPYFITHDDVRAAIGLRVNVRPLNKAQFTKRVWDAFNTGMDMRGGR